LSFQFLETIKGEYETRGYLDKEDLTRFEDYIEEQMDLFSHHPEKVDKIKGIQQKVDDVKAISRQNIEKLNSRGERLENVTEKVQTLEEQSTSFRHVSRKLKCVELKRNIIVTIVLIICCLILIGVLIGIIYYFVKK